MGGEKKVVEERYWSCGVGGLWGFKGGWPRCLSRSQAGELGMDRTLMIPLPGFRTDWPEHELCHLSPPSTSQRTLRVSILGPKA
jgi:hypothetical protein